MLTVNVQAGPYTESLTILWPFVGLNTAHPEQIWVTLKLAACANSDAKDVALNGSNKRQISRPNIRANVAQQLHLVFAVVP